MNTKNKIFISGIFLISTLFSEHYYFKNKKINLTKIDDLHKVRTNNNIKYYLNDNGNKIGISNKIIIKLKESLYLDIIQKKYNLTYIKEISDNTFVFSTNIDVLELIEDLTTDPNIEYSEPDFLLTKKYRTNDPLYSNAWHIKDNSLNNADSNIEGAWEITKGAGIKIGILDDGFDSTHPDLINNIKGTFNFHYYNNDVRPDQLDGGSPTSLITGAHGTAVAGIIGAEENDIGSLGVAPKSKLYLAKDGEYLSDTISAFNWFLTNDVDIISNSWGTYNLSQTMDEVFQKLKEKGRNGKGIIIVFASGNDSLNLDNNGVYDESESEHVIGIGASSISNRIEGYSNYGSKIDFLAPSASVTTDISGSAGYVDGDYTSSFDGTSASAPVAAGIIGLMLSANPNLTFDQVFQILTETVDEIETNPLYGYGKINAERAVKKALETQNDYEINKLDNTYNKMTLTTNKGWNLVGTNIEWGNLKDIKFNNCVKAMFEYDSEKNKWNIFYRNNDGSIKLDEIDFLKKNSGLWIYTNNSCNIETNIPTNTNTYFKNYSSIIDTESNKEWYANSYMEFNGYQTAASFCNNLENNSKDDWRLPTKEELKQLMTLHNSNNVIVEGIGNNHISITSTNFDSNNKFFISTKNAYGFSIGDEGYTPMTDNIVSAFCVRDYIDENKATSLANNWNLIGISKNIENINEVLLPECVRATFKYNSLIKDWEINDNETNRSDFTRLDEGKGVWIYGYKNCNLNY